MDKQPSLAQQIGDAMVTRQVLALRVAASLQLGVEGILFQLAEDLRDLVLRADLESVKRIRYRRDRRDKLIREGRAKIREAYASIRKLVAPELRSLGVVEGNVFAAQLNPLASVASIPLAVLGSVIGAKILREALLDGGTVADWWERQAANLFDRFKRHVTGAEAAREGSASLIQRLRGTAAGGRPIFRQVDGGRQEFMRFRGGLRGYSVRQAFALLQTAANAVSNRGRQEAAEANDELVEGVAQLSTLDHRTTRICRGYADKRWRLPDYKPVGHSLPYRNGCPRHMRCRSVIAAWLKTLRELGIRPDELPADLRGRLDDPVPRSTSQEAWFARLSQARQDAILGPGAAGLFRRRRLTFRQLLDAQGRRPLTLAELEAQFGAAA